MRALYKYDAGEQSVEVREAEIPSPKSDELLVKVHATGVCGTDLHIVKDEYPSNYPVIMGHEFSGEVSRVGSAVTAFAPGDRVVSLTAVVTCGECEYCANDLLMLCDKRLSIGSGVNGAFAEYLAVPESLAFKIPDNVSLEEAALTEPLACVVRGVIEKSTVNPGDYVLISGPGPIGLLVLQLALNSGAKTLVSGTDSDAERLRLASELGAGRVVSVPGEDIISAAESFTDGAGFDVVFECAGVPASADTCLRLVKKAGVYSQVALFGNKPEFDMDKALTKELTLTNSYASERSSWVTALKLMEQGRVNLKPLISAVFPLERWREAFDMAESKEGYKILISPGKEF
jgi:L-iditol 2-dehydrogenase